MANYVWTRESVQQAIHVRWFNLQYEPAVKKSVEEGHFSDYIAKKLLDPRKHLARKRVPSLPDAWWDYLGPKRECSKEDYDL